MKTMKNAFLVLLSGIITFSACKKDVDVFKPQVSNQSDNFSFLASNVSNGTGSYEYTWINTGTKANITISTQGQAAQMDVKVYDGAGAEVYANSLDNNGSFTTNTGIAGQWKIVFVFKTFNGNILVTAKKA